LIIQIYKFITIFSWYPDPDQRFLIRIRIRILANDTDPTGSGSETLVLREQGKQ
jgi:hypothetical protein